MKAHLKIGQRELKGDVEIDKLAHESGMSSSSLAASLLEMEMNGIIVSLPGKRYKLL